jgi:hypothetical protein
MFEHIWQGASDISVAGSSAAEWVVAVVVASIVVAFVLAAARDRFDRPGWLVTQIADVLLLAMAGLWALNGLVRPDVAAERRALEERAFELASRAFMPGSPLACLDPIVGGRVEDGCEKSLFATPEATAAAVGYVAAQLSLLASTRDNGAPGHANALASLRRSVEADRFGVVAHVLAVRDRCTPDQCAAFAYLQGTSRISANLTERPFDAYLEKHITNWPATGGAQMANRNPSPGPLHPSAPKVPNNLYFPSSSSIPPVNIMTVEPQAPPAHDPAGNRQSASQRKQPPVAQSASQTPAPSAPAARSTPLQLSPGAQ